jgi:UDP-glucose 4-epimerase
LEQPIKILVSGAGGFVGQRLARLLAERGQDVVALVHAPPEGPVAARLQHPRIRVDVFDLECPDVARLPRDVQGVIALAQSQHFRNFPERVHEIFQVNIAAHLALLEWSRTVGVKRFVYASSGGVYGPSARLSVAENESFSVDSPLGFYLGSKLCAEVIFQNYRHFFDTAIVLRPFFIYGPGQRSDMLIPRLIQSVRTGQVIKLQGPDGLRLNPVYVADAVEGFIAALEAPGHQVLNLAGADALSLRALCERIGHQLGRAPCFEQAQGAPSDYVASTEAAERVLGRPVVGIDEGLRLTLNGEVN